MPSHFWAAGFSFALALWLVEVPYCPHLPHLFFGEEQYMLLRMWTRGWDVFAPTQPVVFHQWERSARPSNYQACIKVGGVTLKAPLWSTSKHPCRLPCSQLAVESNYKSCLPWRKADQASLLLQGLLLCQE